MALGRRDVWRSWGWKVAVAALGITAIGAQCGPTRTGPDLEILRGTTQIYARDPPLGDSAYDEGDLELVPYAEATTTPEQQLTVNFRHRYEANAETYIYTPDAVGVPPTTFTFRPRPELHMFARDPREVYRRLTRSTLPVDWPAATKGPYLQGNKGSPYMIAADLVLPYASADGSSLWDNGFQYATATPYYFTFFRAESGAPTTAPNWSTLVRNPTGTASIKALRQVTLPGCSTSVPFWSSGTPNTPPGALTQFKNQIATQIQKGCVVADTFIGRVVTKTTIDALTVTSYLNHTAFNDRSAPPTLPNSGLRSGFLVAGQITARFLEAPGTVFGPNTTPCVASFIYDYEWKLDGGATGYLTVDPHRILFAVNDPGADLCNGVGGAGLGGRVAPGLVEILTGLLDRTVPGQIHRTAIDAQAIPPVVVGQPVQAPFNGPTWKCRYRPESSGDLQDDGECSSAITTFQLAVRDGYRKLGFGVNPPQALLDVTADRRNWRCRVPTAVELPGICAAGAPIRGQCQFKVPASDFIGEPDEVRLRLVTSGTAFDQPGTAALLCSFREQSTEHISTVQSDTGRWRQRHVQPIFCGGFGG